MTAEKVREIAAAAFLDAIDVQIIIETLETGNTPLVAAAVQTVRTDKVVQCIYRSLWTRLLVVVARAYAKARQGDLHVQYAFDLLKEPRARSGVESTGNAAVLAEAIASGRSAAETIASRVFLTFETNRSRTGANWMPKYPYQSSTIFSQLAEPGRQCLKDWRKVLASSA
jgi:hypothetical protein